MHSLTEIDNEIEALTQAENFEDAARLLSEHWLDYLSEHADQLRDRIFALPDEQWTSSVPLLLALASSLRSTTTTNAFAALPYLDAVDVLLAVDQDHSPDLEAISALVRCAAVRGLGRFADARDQALAAHAALAVAPIPLPRKIELETYVLLEEGICLTLLCELEDAGDRLRHGLALWDDKPTRSILIEALGCLAIVDYFCGTPAAPQTHASNALEAARSTNLSERPSASPALFAECMLAIDDGRVDTAASLLVDLQSVAGGSHYELLGMHVDAVLRGHAAGPLEQLEVLQEMQIASRDWPTPNLVQHLHDSERVSALVQLGSMSAARDAIATMSSIPDPNHVLCVARLLARLELHTANFEGALDATAACRTLGDHHPVRSLAWVDALRSCAHSALGDARSASVTFDRLLTAAARTGWRRHLTTLPHDRLSALIDAARGRTQPEASLAVLDDIAGCLALDSVDSIPPLSSRERLILRHIVAGETRNQISSELSVSPNTIKTQVRSIYRKLGAANRHEAIDRAAKYGITV